MKTYEHKQSYKLNNGTTIYMLPSMFADHATELEAVSDYILKHCKNLHSLDISDVSAGGIQIGGTHNANPGYIIMNRTIHYNFDNLDDIIKSFIAEWNSFMDEDVAAFKRFTDDGEKYGWD